MLTDTILDSIMKMKDVFREILIRKANGIFIIRQLLTFGRTEFRRRWGDRKLEDNWRRSNKTRVNTSQASAIPKKLHRKELTLHQQNSITKNLNSILKTCRLTDSLINISNDKIANALLNAGKAYSERISDTVKATETFESLINRFPDNELVPEALYNLYKINKEVNNAKSEVYRQKLLQKYPESEFARILSDPAYYEKKMADLKMAEKIYDEAYNAYTSVKNSMMRSPLR